MSRYCITGGAGFIGSHLVEELVNLNHEVFVIDNLSSGKVENLKIVFDRIEFYERNILDLDSFFNSVRQIDGIFHLAALRSVPKSFEIPFKYHKINIDGTLYLLKKCKEYNIPKFINTSSSSVYGNVDKFPQEEGQEKTPISPYAMSKKIGEEYCKMFSELYGLNTCSLRYFNVFGERQNLDDDYSAVIPKFINNILNNESCPIYGTGEQSRDFTYVKNVVLANILAMNSKKQLKGESFNVGCGESIKVSDLFNTIADITNFNARKTNLPTRIGDVFKSESSLKKINSYLGYVPKYNFKDGLKITIDWWKEKRNEE